MIELTSPTFSFDFICLEEIDEEIHKLINRKATQNTDIPVKILSL